MNKKEFIRQLQEERAAKKRRTRTLALAGLAATVIGLGTYATYTQRHATPAPIPPTRRHSTPTPIQPTQHPIPIDNPRMRLEAILDQHCVITHKQDGSGPGILYIVGQTHWQPAATRHGMKWTGNGDPDYIPHTQAEIYRLIRDLNNDAALRLVIGEGLGPNELGSHEGFARVWQQCGKDETAFFKKTTGQLGYTLAKDVLGDRMALCGADDTDEMRELESVNQKLFAIADKYLSAMNAGSGTSTAGTPESHVPLQDPHAPAMNTPLPDPRLPSLPHHPLPQQYTQPQSQQPYTQQPQSQQPYAQQHPRHPFPQTAHLLSKMHEEEEPLRKRRDDLNHLRSTIYLQDALRIAAQRKEKDVMIVIGMAHAQKMIADYLAITKRAENSRTLYVLVPKSVPADERTRWVKQ